MDPDRLTEDELAERSGTSREYIRQLADLGILQADDRGTFTRQDVMRARVVTDLHAIGIATEALAIALASGHLTLGYLESAGRRHPRSDRTFAEVAKRDRHTVHHARAHLRGVRAAPPGTGRTRS